MIIDNLLTYFRAFLGCYIFICCFVHFIKNYIASKKNPVFEAEIIERIEYGRYRGLRVVYNNAEGDELIKNICFNGFHSSVPSKYKVGDIVKVFYYAENKYNIELYLYQPAIQLFWTFFFLILSVVSVILCTLLVLGL